MTKTDVTRKDIRYFIFHKHFRCGNVYFNDKLQKILIVSFFLKNCKIYDYSDLKYGRIYPNEQSRKIYHTRGLSSVPEEEKYYYNPQMVLEFGDGFTYEEIIRHGKTLKESVAGLSLQYKNVDFGSKMTEISEQNGDL